MDFPVDQWDPDTFKTLESLLRRHAEQPKTSTLRQLVAGIDAVFPFLSSLTRLPAPSESDKTATHKSTITFSGQDYIVDGDLFARADQIASIGIAHSLAARIAFAAHQRRHDYPRRDIQEIGVWLISAWTIDLLNFLHELLRLTLTTDLGDTEAFAPLSSNVQDLLATRAKLGNGDGTWIDLILDQLEALQTRLDGLIGSTGQLQGAAYDLLRYRIEAARDQQGRLLGLIALLAQAGMIGRGQAVKVVKWLKKRARPDAVVVGVFATLVSNREEWCKDAKFMRLVSRLAEDTDWANQRLQQSTRLAWGLFCVTGPHRDPDLLAYTDDGYPLHALSNGAIDILDESLSRLRVERGLDDNGETADMLAQVAQASMPANDDFLLGQLKELVKGVVGRKTLLKQLRNREEDAPKKLVDPPKHYSRLLAFVAKLYDTQPSDLWHETTFIDSILDRPPTPEIWKLLIAISNSPTSAQSAFERLDRTKFTLTNLMGFLAHDAEQLFKIIPSPNPHKSNLAAPAPFSHIPPDELERLLYWPKLTAAIARQCPAARAAILHPSTESVSYPLKPLFDMLNTDASLEHKEAFLDAITALLTPLGDGRDEDTYIKAAAAFEAISPGTDPRPMSRRRRLPQQGWLAQVESAEQVYGGYPLTRSYLRFLTTMLSATRWEALQIPYRAVDEVFVYLERFRNGHYQYRLRRSEQYDLLDEMLAFVEKAIMRFDMADLAAMSHNMYEVAWGLYQQPGFRVILELLVDGSTFDVLANVLDHLVAMSTRNAVHDTILRRVLRIYNRIFDVQLVFTEVLLLTLDHSPRWSFVRPTDWQPLDARLLNHLSNITNIAMLVNDGDLQISLLAVKVIYALAGSATFDQNDRFGGARTVNRLAGIIDASDDSIRIAQCFHHRLQEDGPSDVGEVTMQTLEGVLPVDRIDRLPIAIRSIILDMLLDGTLPGSSANIAHFLLGFEFKGHDFVIQEAPCLQVLLDQLENGDEILVHPVIAAKTAKLVYQLFSSPLTARATIQFSSARGSCSAMALRNLPDECPETTGRTGIVRNQQSEYETTGEAFVAYLDYQRYVVACVSLETHSNQGLLDSAADIAEELFGGRLISLLTNLDLVWHEPTTSKNIEHFAHFNFDQFKQPDIDWYDLARLRTALQVEGKRMTGDVDEEISHIIDSLAALNRDAEINVAKGALLTAWAELLKVALGRVFVRHVPEDRQEDTLFSLLEVILSRLDDDVTSGVLEVLSEGALIVVDALRSVSNGALPVEQLVNALQRITGIIVKSGTTETGRGNLYAAINQFLSLLVAPIIDDGASIAADPTTELRRRTLAVMASKKERFFATLCRDALEVRDVWKTECFALLGGLVGICGSEKERQVMSPMWKDGYLGLFVRSLKDREAVLAESLSPAADNLHAFWVFEAKMSLLLAVAATRRGAEDLLDAGLFEVLAMSAFISAPDAEASRQHRVLVLVLQLLLRTLTSLSSSPRSGAQQALAFLGAHRDVMVELLRNVIRSPTAIAVEEGRLIVSLLAMAVQKLPRAGHDLHSTVMEIAAASFDAERFEAHVQRAILGLNQVILAYLCACTSGLKAAEGTPVFVNGSNGRNKAQNTPSLLLVLDFLSDLIRLVQNVLDTYGRLSPSLREGGEIIKPDVERLEALDWADELVFDSGDSVKASFAAKIQTLLGMIELVLLLIWRHVLFYANDAKQEPVRPNSLSQSLMASVRSSTRAGAGDAYRSLREVAKELRANLAQISDVVVLPQELRRPGGEAYFGMLTRRLGELAAGLVGEE